MATDCTLESLKCAKLVELCKKHKLPIKYRNKSELIIRLEDFFAKPTHQVPCKEFFEYMSAQWKDNKKDIASDDEQLQQRRLQWFKEYAELGRKEMSRFVTDTEDQQESKRHLEWILAQSNASAELLAYYQRGKAVWKGSDSSSGAESSEDSEDQTIATVTAAASASAASDSGLRLLRFLWLRFLWLRLLRLRLLRAKTV